MRPLILFLLSSLWFAMLIPWSGWNDPDAYYHAAVSQQIWQHGPLKTFPSLDLTLLGTSYADLHFGFHLFAAPFTALFGSLMGLRIATIMLTALCVVVFEAGLRWLKIQHSLVWAGLLAIANPFVFRALLGKATPLAVMLFLFGLTAAWKRRPWLMALAAALYALSHGGWVYLAGSVVLLAFGDMLYSRIVQDMNWRAAFFASRWREICVAWLGGIAGMLVHPNADSIFRFSWAQVVTIGLGTPWQHVLLGQEWSPISLTEFVTTLAPWMMVMIVGLSGLVFARRAPLNEHHARLLTSLGWIMAVLVALTFKSRRNIEYLIPVVVFWCAVLWSFVDIKKLRAIFTSAFRYASAFLVTLLAIVFAKQTAELYARMNPPNYSDGEYQISMDAISANAIRGDRVFHSSWDEFPILYHANPSLKYISGLDPTFLYIASSTLSDRVRNVTWDLSTSTKDETWNLIVNQLHSRFVFISKKYHQKMLERVEGDARYVKIGEDEESAAFEIAR